MRLRLTGMLLLTVAAGCSGGGSPAPQNQNQGSTSNENQTLNLNDNDHPPPAPVDELLVQISGVPDSGQVVVGMSYTLAAEVSGAEGEVTFDWQIEQQSEGAVLDDPQAAAPTLDILAAGDFSLSVTVADASATSTSQTDLRAGAPQPPPEARLEVLVGEMVAGPGEFVTLIATTAGPTPRSLRWAPAADNIIDPIDFVDFGDGTATFTVPSQFGFIYILQYTVTATYDTGTLSDTTSIVVSGSP